MERTHGEILAALAVLRENCELSRRHCEIMWENIRKLELSRYGDCLCSEVITDMAEVLGRACSDSYFRIAMSLCADHIQGPDRFDAKIYMPWKSLSVLMLRYICLFRFDAVCVLMPWPCLYSD